MERIIREIFEKVIIYERDFIKMDRKVAGEIRRLADQRLSRSNGEQKEKAYDMMYEVALRAEEEGFMLGFKYALKLIAVVLRD